MSFKFELLHSLLLTDFPSGSAINFYEGQLYLTGDDASHILILDTSYKITDTIKLFNATQKRIAKPEKADLEAAVITELYNEPHLLVFGSASRKERKSIFIIPLLNTSSLNNKPLFETFPVKEFIKRFKNDGIDEVNIEGATIVDNLLVLSNRGNRGNPENYIIVTAQDFWTRQDEANIFFTKLSLSEKFQEVPGISDLCYVREKNILLLTLSSESTCNAFDDGAIGDSYIGWIKDYSNKINEPIQKLNGLINLCEVDAEFKGEKIEGLCVEEINGNELTLHFISDNDLGESKLFKLKMSIED